MPNYSCWFALGREKLSESAGLPKVVEGIVDATTGNPWLGKVPTGLFAFGADCGEILVLAAVSGLLSI